MPAGQVKFLDCAVGGRAALRRGIAVRFRNPGIATAVKDDVPRAIDGIRGIDARRVGAVGVQESPGQGDTARQRHDCQTQAHDQSRVETP